MPKKWSFRKAMEQKGSGIQKSPETEVSNVEFESEGDPVKPVRPVRPSLGEAPRVNVSHEEIKIEPEPPQPVFVDPGYQPTAPTLIVKERERAPLHESSFEVKPAALPPPSEPALPLPAQPRSRRAWKPPSFRAFKDKIPSFRSKEKPAVNVTYTGVPAYRYPADQEGDRRAMERFRANLTNWNMHHPPGKAWGFDYVNWKPVGYRRRETHPNDFVDFAWALAPYVACVKESAWQGIQERSALVQPEPLGGVRSGISLHSIPSAPLSMR